MTINGYLKYIKSFKVFQKNLFLGDSNPSIAILIFLVRKELNNSKRERVGLGSCLLTIKPKRMIDYVLSNVCYQVKLPMASIQNFEFTRGRYSVSVRKHLSQAFVFMSEN
jgi:hypothetical protein